MLNSRLGLGIATSLLLTACTNLPSEETAKNADYGSYPDNYEEVIKTYYDYNEHDPKSIQYRAMTEPKKYWLGNRLDDVYYGYLVCVTLNSKNLIGEYSGFHTDAVIIKDQRVVKHVDDGDWWGEQLCPPASK